MNVYAHVRHRRGLAGLVLVACLLVLSGLVTPPAAAAEPDASAKEVLTDVLKPLDPPGAVAPAASSPPAPTFAGNRNEHIVLLNGYATSSQSNSKDVNGEWDKVIPALQGWGWPSGKDAQNRDWIGGAAIYNCDTNFSFNTESHGSHHTHQGSRSHAENHDGDPACGGNPCPGFCDPFFSPRPKTTSHTTETSIEHIAYHFAWMIKDTFGTECIKVIAHSMGGLVVRYAVARVDEGHGEFPGDICVEDVVTLGTPHNGAENPLPGDFCPDYQCEQQMPGSDFLDALGTGTGLNPQTNGGTDWTAMGSTGDGTAPADSATGANLDPAHAVIFEEPDLAHSNAQPWDTLYWKNATASDITANIRWTDAALVSEATTLDGPWPIRHADMSLAYNQWGCGVGNTTSAFPLKNGVVTVGEPYTTSTDCWYYIDVFPTQQLKVALSSLNNKDMDLFVYQGSPTASPTCSSASSASTESCTINAAAFGRWYVKVRNFAQTRDPFTLQATQQNDCSTGVDAGNDSASATTVSTPISNCGAFLAPAIDGEDWYKFPVNSGQQISATIAPNSSADFDLCLYDPSGNVADCSFNGTGSQDNVTATSSVTGTWRIRANSFGGSSGTYNLSINLVTPQNDCGTGVDAGDGPWEGTPITLPKTDCSGLLLSGNEFDLNDYYTFPVSVVGTQINASVTPNATSNYDICIYNQVATLVAGCTAGSVGGTDSLSYTTTSTGEFRVHVRQTSGTGPYTMSVSAEPPNDCGTGVDAGGTHGSATTISLPKSNCTAALTGGADTSDYYQFSVASGAQIDASMTPNASSNFNICLYNPSGSLVAGCTTGSTGGTDTLTHTATTTGNYRLRVTTGTGSGSYTMSVSATSQNDCGIGGDAGGTHGTASTISLPKSNCSGTLTGGSDVADYYQFSVTSGQIIDASLTNNPTSDFDICIYNPSGTLVAGCTAGSTGGTDTLSHTATATGNYRLAVTPFSGTGTYTMSVSASAPPQNDCGIGVDAGSSHAGASSISLPKTNCSGQLVVSSDTADWYQFSVTNGHTINASMTPNASSDFDLCLYDPSGTQVACSAAGTGGTDSITHAAGVTGSWRLQVFIFGSSPGGTYTMSVSTSPPPQNDCGVGGDAGNSHAGASSISLPKTNCSGQLLASDQDWYQFSVTSGHTINASMTPNASADFDICLFDPSGNQVGSCTAGSAGSTDTLSAVAGTTGNYRLQVKIWSGTGTYTMSVSTSPPGQNDCGIGADAGNTHSAASLISLPKTNCTGTLVDGSDVDDYYKFSVTSGQTINASLTNNASSDYDICIYNPSGSLVAGCTAGSTGGTDTLSHTATATGDYRLRVTRFSGTGNYTMSVSKSSGPVTIRTDDNERDTNSPFNYDDDVAVKRLNVTSTNLSGKTTATLHVMAKSYSCGATGNKFRLRANNNVVAEFNPCNEWSTTSFSWKAFNVPISYITAGTATFNLEYIPESGADWTSRNIDLAVDSDTVPDNSDISFDSNNVNGELMWYLVLS